jgi:chemosensory pili system protein ChpE
VISTLLAGAVIAISFSAPPGPVAMETIRRGLRGGFGPALHVQLGSIIGDMAWCVLALIGLAPLVQIDFIRLALGVAGVGLLIFLGTTGIRDAFKQSAPASSQIHDSGQGAFRSGMAISLANPQAVGYWLSVGGALVASGAVGGQPAQTAGFITGFVSGTLLWAVCMAFAVRFGKRILHPLAFRAITFVCGIAMIVFGVVLATQMVGAWA